MESLCDQLFNRNRSDHITVNYWLIQLALSRYTPSAICWGGGGEHQQAHRGCVIDFNDECTPLE